MAYKSVKKRREYAKRWRQKHPTYMRDYYRFGLPKYNPNLKPKQEIKP